MCGERVFSGLHQLVSAHPSLTHLSLVGYSMGGLIAHYLAGRLAQDDPEFLGLQPRIFATMACPHLARNPPARLAEAATTVSMLLRRSLLVLRQGWPG